LLKQTYTANGETRTFTVPFPFISRDHIGVTVNEQPASFTWVNGATVQLATTPAAGAPVSVTRSTPIAPLVAFVDDQLQRASDYNMAIRQGLYVAEEATAEAQRVDVDVSSSLRRPENETDVPMLLPVAPSRAGKLLGFDGSGAPTAVALDTTALLQRPEGEDSGSMVLPPKASRSGKLLGFDGSGAPTAVMVDTSAALRRAEGDTAVSMVLPPAETRAGKVLGFDGSGSPTAVTLDASGAPLPSPDQINVVAPYAHTQQRTLASKLADSLNAADFGVVGDGTTDDTDAFQMAVWTAAQVGKVLHVNNGRFRFTRPITSSRGVRIWGQGCEPMASNPNPVSDIGSGTWFHFDHAGEGFVFGHVASFATGFEYVGIGHIRSQPSPHDPSFEALNYGFDIVLNNTEIWIDRVIFLTSSRGIQMPHGAAGRLRIGSISGQPLICGIDIVESYDVTSFNHIHFWPMWSNNPIVLSWMATRSIAIKTGRCDGLVGTNLFVFGYHIGHQIYGIPAGTTLRAQIVNAYFDLCVVGVQVAPSVGTGGAGSTYGAIVTYTNYVSSGPEWHLADCVAVAVWGADCDLTFTNFESVFSGYGAIRSLGNNNRISLTGRVAIRNWGRDRTANWPALEASSGDTLMVHGDLSFFPSAATALYSASGKISIPGKTASGVVDVPSGPGRTVGVHHGLGREPKISEIVVWPIGQSAGSAGFHVQNVTSETFEIYTFGTLQQAMKYGWKVTLA
jgi:hypothetical protein